MAFPWLFEENFETGTKGSFASETDDLGLIDFPGPQDDLAVPPYHGGYVMRVDMNRSVVTTPTPAYVTSTTGLIIASGTTQYARIMMYLDDDVVCPGFGVSGTAVDFVRFLQLRSASAEEASLVLTRSDKGDLMIGILNPDYSTTVPLRGIGVMRNEWFCIEMKVAAHTTNAEVQIQIGDSQLTAAGMPWATLTEWRLGAISRTVDVRGIMYFDSVVLDEDRLVAPQPIDPRNLDGEVRTITKTGFAFVGPGAVNSVTLVPMQANDFAYLYDTDRLPVAHHDLRMSVKAGSVVETLESKGPREFTRGCYVVLSAKTGTAPNELAPTAIVQLGAVSEYGWGAFGEEGFAA